MIYEPGTILLLEEGEYSDFGYCAQMVTLCRLDIKDAVDKYREQYKPKNEWDRPNPDGFAAWLCATQQCAGLNCQTLHIGSYGELKINGE